VSWKVWAGVGAAVAFFVVAAAALVYLLVLTMPLTVDGRATRLSRGAVASEVFARKLATRRNGNLVSAGKRHDVIKVGGGETPYVQVNGQTVGPADQLPAGAVVVTFNGTDTVEPTKVTQEEIPAPIEYQGAGPVESVIESGSAGVREITVGTLSKQIVREKVERKPVSRVIVLSMPGNGTKMIALTFDDGPWPGSTKAIVKILQDNGVVATFFQVGRQARQQPALARLVVKAGMDVANHSETHPLNLGKLSTKGVSNEITQAQFDITKASGQAPKFFRPPGGNTTQAMYAPLDKLGLKWVQWDIDTGDWRKPPAKKIVATVLSRARPGAVVLMHDGGGDRSATVAALPAIIKGLKAQGYVFVKLGALKSIPHRMG
jgi:peptidoglycan/xylan/chitin deacetylase (PgdA/CDA1 family)